MKQMYMHKHKISMWLSNLART